MGFFAWLTLGVLVLVFVMLSMTRRSPDLILLGGLTILLVTGVLEPEEAFSGFSNEGIITVGLLFVVSAGLRESGAVYLIASRLFGQSRTIRGIQSRMLLPVAGLSAFLNNTPLVAMLLPVVTDWSKKYQLPVSKLLIPLSYAAILGGTCTLIGTSTNLVVNGLLLDTGFEGLSLFSIAKVGIPCTIAGLIFMFFTNKWLLPDRSGTIEPFSNPREYSVEMVVEEQSPLIGKTIEQAGLRHLSGLYLIEIERKGKIIPAVGPEEILLEGDRLVFVGVVDSILDLQRMRGLKPATNQIFKLDAPRSFRVLTEAVVSHTSPMLGKTIREGKFRFHYDAVVIAVARNGQRIKKKIGDIALQPGDTLLLETKSGFAEKHRNSRDFYLVSRVQGFTPPRHEKAWISLTILAGIVLTVGFGFFSMVKAASLGAGLMIVTGCISGDQARKAVEWRLLLAIAAAFGLGHALLKTGVAAQISELVIGLAQGHTYASLIAIYILTVLFTELITNNAAAVLVFPIGLQTATTLDVSYLPFIIAIMMGASASFSTPIGYQTNLMVYGPGGYHFRDFLRAGIPMTILVGIVTLSVIPWFWPF